MTDYSELIDGIKEGMENMIDELESSHKTAVSAKRARSMSLDLTKKFKEFRKVSVQFFKDKKAAKAADSIK